MKEGARFPKPGEDVPNTHDKAIEKEGITHIEISPEILELLKTEQPEKARQQLLSTIFSQERKNGLLHHASVDSKGRRVVYFREMSWERFLQLIEKKKMDAPDHFPDSNEKFDPLEFKIFLMDYAEFLRWPEEDLEQLSDRDMLRSLSLHDIIQRIWPQIPQEDVLTEDSLTVKNVIAFVDKYCDEKYIRRRHSGSFAQKFSPYLSMSVVGIISNYLPSSRVYVEMTISDERVIAHPQAIAGEKEVFVKELRCDDVLRVHLQEQLYTEISMNPDTAVGKYHKEYGYGGVDHWRWEEPTEEYLPVGLVNKD